MGQQMGLNLAWLDTDTAQLDLLIEAALEAQGAIGIPGGEITGFVEAGGGIGGEGIGNEPCGGERGVLQIAACESGSADLKLTGNSDRTGMATFIHHMHRGVG